VLYPQSRPAAAAARLRRLIGELRDLAWLVRRRFGTSDDRARQYARLTLLERAARAIMPEYVITEHSKLWFEDDRFLEAYDRLEHGRRRSADRKYLVRSFAASVADLPGDTAEAGIYHGSTSWFICEALRGTGKTHHAFDSFEGLAEPGGADGQFWRRGDMLASEELARERLSPYPAEIHKGWIPACFEKASIEALCFAHIDVDLYAPTLEAMRFFYPLMVSGGVIVCDDYGFTTCPGAKRAVDEYMADRPESVVHVPTGQAFVVKR